jgi:hypothetical protein
MYMFDFFMHEHWLIPGAAPVMQICWPIPQQLDAESDLEAVMAVAENWS